MSDPRLPSARRRSLVEAFERIGERTYRVVAPTPVRRVAPHHYGSHHLELSFRVGERKDTVDVDVSVYTPNEHLIVLQLVPHALSARRLRFPIDVRITREEMQIRVDDHPTRFTAFACRGVAIAEAEIDGNWVRVQARKRVLRQVSLVREDPTAMRQYLATHDKRRAARRPPS